MIRTGTDSSTERLRLPPICRPRWTFFEGLGVDLAEGAVASADGCKLSVTGVSGWVYSGPRRLNISWQTQCVVLRFVRDRAMNSTDLLCSMFS
jgi:hypothetical protein